MKLFFFFITLNIFALQIDVVVPIHEKDRDRIDALVKNLREKVVDIGNIYFISKEKYSDETIWIDEALFPFSIEDVGNELKVGKHNRCGWYFQQILKFYAPLIIEDISDFVLIFDADTLITRPTRFLDEENRVYLDMEAKKCGLPTYYSHMGRLFPALKEVDMAVNPVVNHALFSKEIIEDLIAKAEEEHNLPFWKSFLQCVDMKKYRPCTRGFTVGASEYMIYYHFCMYYHQDKVIPRTITISNQMLKRYRKEASDYFDFKTINNVLY